MARSKSSGRWLREHFGDAFVREAQARGLRSRAAFKLLEIDRRDRLLRPGLTVVDLGAAPGGWSQVAADAVGPHGRVLALDLLALDPLPGVTCLQADFTEDAGLAALLEALGGRQVDLVMSDMAPNISGVKAVDQPRAELLAELALEFARQVLRPGGDLLLKVFQGPGFQPLLAALREAFAKVVVRKPEASRARSAEVYLVARNYRLV
ncbi:MAG TPA: 23S rRNA (uridine(2552)-2'-O)-methyltransferase RlmE [Gammaproteobacteria bacterium]